MERTDKRDAPDITTGNASEPPSKRIRELSAISSSSHMNIDAGNAGSYTNEGDITSTSERIPGSISPSSSLSSLMDIDTGSLTSSNPQLPSVDELTKTSRLCSASKVIQPESTEDYVDILQVVVGKVILNAEEWNKVLDPRLISSETECGKYLNENDKVRKLIDESIKNKTWEPLFSYLRKIYSESLKSKSDDSLILDEQRQATVLSWKADFMGQAPTALKAHVNKYFSTDPNSVWYGNFCAIIQSSGMGKSRLVDQFSLENIVIPINLRPANSAGYPPGDTPVVNFLERAGSKLTPLESNRLLCYFLTELVNETIFTFEKLGSTSPKDLHDFFERGMDFEGHGEDRRKFYENVVTRASIKLGQVTETSNSTYDRTALKEFRDALKRLLQFISDQSISEQQNTPLVFFSFDEAHSLIKPLRDSKEQSHMRQLRRILAEAKKQRLFTFFISTTGKFSSVVRPHHPDASTRLSAGKRELVPAFSDLGYDHFAWENEISKIPLLLSRITQISFMANFGRPMWGLRLKNLADDEKDEILTFAKLKLLNQSSKMANAQKLACLSQRLALEYNTKNYFHIQQELTQIEGHLRVLLQIDERAESITSTSPSEPLVAEAAALAMKDFDAAEAMKSVLESFSISQGDRGELIAMLLLTLARDAAITKGPPILRIPNLIRSLFPPTYANLVLNMKPTISPENSEFSTTLFKERFKNAGTHFSHFTKAYETRLYSQEELLALMLRGSFVLCGNGAPGMDLCGAGVLDIDDVIRKLNSFIIIWQIQNDPHITETQAEDLMNDMDPVHLGIFHENDAQFNIPIIRIIFSLAAAKVKVMPMKPRSNSNTKFTCYDIWCAGLSPEVFLPVKATNKETWTGLLNSSRRWGLIYKDIGTSTETLRRQKGPGAGKKRDHWSQWIEYREMPKLTDKETEKSKLEYQPLVHPDD